MKNLCGAIAYVSCALFLVVAIDLETATVPIRGYMRNGETERFSDLPSHSSTWIWPDPPRFRPPCFGLCTREELP